jgi:glycosyltransferase involved in cell wall biosynthesis
VPYKRIDLIVDAFAQMPDRRLVVIGDGPDAAKLRGRLTPNIQFLGYQPLPALREHLRQARAFIFAAEEDFGIAPLEAQACGTPVVAFGRGGARESVRGLDQAEPTGVFFFVQTVAALRSAVDRFEHAASQLTPEACRANAVRFEAPRFRRQFRNYVESQWQEFRSED